MFGKVIRALVVASLLLVGQAAAPSDKASAYNMLGKWTDYSLTYCFTEEDAGPVGSVRKDMFRNAFDKWENIVPLTFTEDCGPFGTFFDIQISEMSQHWSNPNGALANTILTASGSTTAANGQSVARITKGHIRIFENHFSRIRYQTSNPTCWMFPAGYTDACKGDGYTIIVHEIGHIVGLGDLAWGYCHPGYLSGGNYWYYYMNQWQDSCDTIGDRLMKGNAGMDGWNWDRDQGFRVGPFDTDTRNGVEALYG